MSTLLVAKAQAQDGNVERAKMLFNAGASTYASGQFKAAIQAFEEANRLYPKPQILFSLAQARRRQYFLDKNPEQLRRALKEYREYLDQVPEGGRRADAAQAVAELELVEARLGVDARAATTITREPTRILVRTTPEDATVLIDGKPSKSGLAIETNAKRHRVRVTAAGYAPFERELPITESTLNPVDVVLEEKPALLTVVGDSGTQISIDGRPAGSTPLGAPIEVPSGVHLVVLTKNGHRPMSQEVEFTRDEKKRLDAKLAPTSQRIVSYGFFVGAGAALVTGGVFTAIALSKEGDAEGIRDRQSNEMITGSDADAYDRARSHRDDWARASYVAYGVAAGALATGLVLYLFDAPSLSGESRAREQPKKPTAPVQRDPMEMSFAPWAGPQLAGASIHGRF